MFEELVLLPVPRSTSGGGLQPSRKASRGQEVYWISCLSDHMTQGESKKQKARKKISLDCVQSNNENNHNNDHLPKLFFFVNTVHHWLYGEQLNTY